MSGETGPQPTNILHLSAMLSPSEWDNLSGFVEWNKQQAVAAERERLRVAVEGLRAFGRYKVDMDGDRAVMLDEVLRLLTPDLP